MGVRLGAAEPLEGDHVIMVDFSAELDSLFSIINRIVFVANARTFAQILCAGK